MKRKLLSLFAVLTLSVGLLGGCGDFDDDETFESEKIEEETPASPSDTADVSQDTTDAAQDTADAPAKTEFDDSELLSGKHHCEIVIKDYGPLKIELDADTAPISVTNFVKLAESGFYDGLTFIRIQEDFVIQGGDPTAVGRSDSAGCIKGEFSSNGVENNISHKRGVLSMARSNDPDSGNSQFFIMLADSDFLDGNYAAFGQVTEGMDIVDQVVNDYIGYGDAANMGFISDSENQPVIETIKITD